MKWMPHSKTILCSLCLILLTACSGGSNSSSTSNNSSNLAPIPLDIVDGGPLTGDEMYVVVGTVQGDTNTPNGTIRYRMDFPDLQIAGEGAVTILPLVVSECFTNPIQLFFGNISQAAPELSNGLNSYDSVLSWAQLYLQNSVQMLPASTTPPPISATQGQGVVSVFISNPAVNYDAQQASAMQNSPDPGAYFCVTVAHGQTVGVIAKVLNP